MAGFAADGIRVDYVVRDKTIPSGVALIFVAASGENSIAVASGSNGKLTPADVKKARQAFQKADALVLQLESPLETVQAAAKVAAAIGLPVILNPAPAQPLPKSLLRLISVLTPNEHEAELLTGIAVKNSSNAAHAAAALHAKGIHRVIITMGSRGVFVSHSGSSQMIPGHKVKPLDTTAAGDVFTGALAVALAEGRPLLEAARFANAAAALSVTRLGAQPSAPRRKEIERLLAKDRL
jgi:ribokinase